MIDAQFISTWLRLEGKQGIGKSRALSLLVPDENWYKAGSIDPGDKDLKISAVVR